MSNIRIDNIAPSAGGTYRNAPRGIAAAWAIYETDSPSSIRNSINVSSLTDNGTGDSTFTWVNSFSTSNYSSIGEYGDAGVGDTATFGLNALDSSTPRTSSIVRLETYYKTTGNRTSHDGSSISFSAFGDLA